MAIPEELIARAIAVLQRGGVVAAATETSFGLLADATVPEAIERVLSIKGRPEYQPIALLAASIDVAKEVVRFSSRAARLAEEFWPGPLTLVLPERAPLHPALGKDGRVGVRVPGPSPALDIAVAFAGALTATSANRSGEPSANRIEELGPILERGVDIVIPLPAPGGPPSTLLVEDGSEFRVIREGAIEAARLTAVLAAIESPGG